MKILSYSLLRFLAISGLFFTSAQAATYNLTPISDAYVEVLQPDTNFGGSAILATNFNFPNPIQYTFLMFNLSAIPGAEIITGATLNLYQVTGNAFGINSVRTFRVDDDSWTEGGITWNNQPGQDVFLGENLDGAFHQGRAQWDLFESGNWIVALDQVDGFLSIMLAEAPGGDSARQYCSKESTLSTCSALGATGIPFLEITTVPIPTPVDLSGTIKTDNDTDICAMVLASGQYMFSCDPVGVFSLTDLAREQNGTVKRQIYADGFFPKVDVLQDTVDEAVVMTRSGACPSYNSPPYDPAVTPGSAGKRIDISGKVLVQDTATPICAMVLANGQYRFSCDGTGSYAMNIPLDNNGQFKLQVYADGFAPTIQTFDEFSAVNDVRMARAAECQ